MCPGDVGDRPDVCQRPHGAATHVGSVLDLKQGGARCVAVRIADRRLGLIGGKNAPPARERSDLDTG